jgi:hypothetical protein
MRSEKEKFDEGKYDKAMDKLNDVYDAARNHDEDMTVSEKKELKKLESEKEELKKDIKETSKLDQKKLMKEVNRLMIDYTIW